MNSPACMEQSPVRYLRRRHEMELRGSFPYRVDLDDIDCPDRLGFWLNHLSRKRWVTPAMLVAFVDAVCRVKRWPSPWSGKTAGPFSGGSCPRVNSQRRFSRKVVSTEGGIDNEDLR